MSTKSPSWSTVVLRSLSDTEKELHARLIDIEKQAESERLSSDR